MQGMVLVVDDNRISRELLNRRLVREGYAVVTAVDAQSALDSMELHPIGLVLLDLDLPDRSGYEVLLSIRQNHSPQQLPVFIVSASDDTETMVRCIDADASDYLTKPVQFELLFAKIRQQLRLRPQPVLLQPDDDLDVVLPPPLREGDFLAHYQIGRSLGSGGMGEVFQAEDTRLLRQVAIKLITNEPKAGVGIKRFISEARALARVDHPGVVKIFEIGLEPCRFLAMEFVEGRPFTDALQGRGMEDIRYCAVQLLDALASIHLQGVVHRDLKPGNVLVNTDWEVKIMDFGLASLEEMDPLAGDSLYGTPQYMAPEAFSNELGRVDSQSDLFAVSVMLYQCVCGRFPFAGKTLTELICNVLEKEPLPPHEINPQVGLQLSHIILYGLEKKKSHRYATARQYCQALRSCEIEPA